MNTEREHMLWLADGEFAGHSFNGPSLPADAGEASYKTMIDELVAFHGAVVDRYRRATPAKLEEPMPGWKVSLGKAFAWLVSHDTNHNTQIRNMGIASLKQK